MLIFKSFFRKKTTKVYLTLFSLLLFSIILLLSFKEYYVSLLKENYKESYLGLVADKKEINKLKKIKNIDNISEYLIGDINSDIEYLTLKSNDELKNNEIILSDHFISKYKINDIINVKINDFVYEFRVKDIKEIQLREALISKEYYELLNNKSTKYEYHLTLNNWIQKEKIIKKLNKSINILDDYGLTVFNSGENKTNINNILAIINITLGVIIIIFFLIYIVSILNTLTDENKSNKLYFNLGYNRRKIIVINNLKMFLLLFSANVISLFSYFIMKYIFRLFKIYVNLDFIYILKIICLFIIVNIVFSGYLALRKEQ